jgi:hypothetical protein
MDGYPGQTRCAKDTTSISWAERRLGNVRPKIEPVVSLLPASNVAGLVGCCPSSNWCSDFAPRERTRIPGIGNCFQLYYVRAADGLAYLSLSAPRVHAPFSAVYATEEVVERVVEWREIRSPVR